MRIMDYKMYTYAVKYTYSAHVRDNFGDITGHKQDATTNFTAQVVAKSRAMADAWIRERYNADYLDHKDFSSHYINEDKAPYLLIEYAG